MIAHTYTHTHTHTTHPPTHPPPTPTHTHTQCGFFRRKKKPILEGTSNDTETDPNQGDPTLTHNVYENIALQETHTQDGGGGYSELNKEADRKNDTSSDDQPDGATNGDGRAYGDKDAQVDPDQSH